MSLFTVSQVVTFGAEQEWGLIPKCVMPQLLYIVVM
jgi:hypothetical protein